MVFMRPDGTHEFYDKRHTFTLAGEDRVYQRGNRKVVWEFRGFRICPQICYDLRFPVFSRNVEDYDLLIYVANWPDARIGAWDTLLKARAIENMAFTAGVNRIGEDPNGHTYTGHSAVYDALGRKMVFSESPGWLEISLDRDQILAARQQLRFLQDRDTFTPGW
jgi:predicted amidohydrolase